MVTPDQFSDMVAERISAAITRADRTRAWVARNAGIPATTFGRKLNGDTSFTVRELARIAQVLGIKESDLLPRGAVVDSEVA